MIVVSDTTPLISLMKISKLSLLRDLFGEILIPEAVFLETTTNVLYKSEAEEIKSSDYIRVVAVKDRERVNLIQRVTGLDLGETEAIVCAEENNADIILIDEMKGRQVAQNMSLTMSGSMGVLIGAYEKGLISSDEVEEALDVLQKSNQRISDKLVDVVLKRIKSEG